MKHLTAPVQMYARQILALAAFVLMVGVGSAAWAQEPPPGSIPIPSSKSAPFSLNSALSEAGIDTSRIGIANTMNFGDCLDFNISICFGLCKCPIGIGQCPVPGIKFKYKEPTTIVEVSCIEGMSAFDGNTNFSVGLLSTGLSADSNDQKCTEPIKTQSGTYNRYYFDTHIWGISEFARYQSSGSAMEVTQSLICYYGGLISQAASFSSAGGDFSFSGAMESLKNMPETLIKNIQELPETIGESIDEFASSIENLAELPAEFAENIQSTIETTMSGLEESLADVQNFAENAGSTLEGLQDDLGSAIEDFQNFDTSQFDGIQDSLKDGFGGFKALGEGLKEIGGKLEELNRLSPVDIPGVSSLSQVGGVLSGVTGTLEGLGDIDFNSLSKVELADIQGAIADIDMQQVSSVMTKVGQFTAPLAFVDPRFGTLSEAAIASGIGLQAANTGGDITLLQGAVATAAVADIVQLGATGSNPVNNQPIPLSTPDESSRLTATGFIQNGQTQIAARMSESEAKAFSESAFSSGKVSKDVAADAVLSMDAVKLCHAQESLQSAKQVSTGVFVQVSDPDFSLGTFDEGTFLPMGFEQGLPAGQANPSCPISHAGFVYVANLNKPQNREKSYVNCVQECSSEPGEPDQLCEWVPAEEFVGDCENNRMSQVQVDGLYPACNGFRPKIVRGQGPDGEFFIEVKEDEIIYDDQSNHLKRLNDARDTAFIRTVTTAYGEIQTSLDVVNTQISRLGGACDTNGRPIGTWGVQTSTATRQAIANASNNNSSSGGGLSAGSLAPIIAAGSLAAGDGFASGGSGQELSTFDGVDQVESTAGSGVGGFLNTKISDLPGAAEGAISSAGDSISDGIDSLFGGSGNDTLTGSGQELSTFDGVDQSEGGSGFVNADGSFGTSDEALARQFGFGGDIDAADAEARAAGFEDFDAMREEMAAELGIPVEDLPTKPEAVPEACAAALNNGTAGGTTGVAAPECGDEGLNWSDQLSGFDSLTQSMDRVDALLREGGIQQMVSGRIGKFMNKYLPFGLWMGFASENTNWREPPFSTRSFLTRSLYFVVNSTPLYLVCSGPRLIADFGLVSDSVNIQKLNEMMGCIGTWGGTEPTTGWSQHKVRPMAGALIGYRGHREALKLGTVQPNTKGTQQFNLDYPPLYRQGGTGGHRGSGCYDVGTANDSWMSPGEGGMFDPVSGAVNAAGLNINPSLNAQLDEGYFVFTYWKRTACCILPCKVKKYY